MLGLVISQTRNLQPATITQPPQIIKPHVNGAEFQNLISLQGNIY